MGSVVAFESGGLDSSTYVFSFFPISPIAIAIFNILDHITEQTNKISDFVLV